MNLHAVKPVNHCLIQIETEFRADCGVFSRYFLQLQWLTQIPGVVKHSGPGRLNVQFAMAATTKYNRLGGLQPEIYFLTILEARSPSSNCQQVWLLSRPLSLACRWPSSCCVLTWSFLWAHACRVSLPLLIRTPVIVDWSPPIWPHSIVIASVKSLSPNTVTF